MVVTYDCLGQHSFVATDLDALYQVIRSVALTRGLITYGDLAVTYASRTGAPPPVEHAGWDDALREINRRLFKADPKAPSITAVVVYRPQEPEPPIAFWGSSPNVPARPRWASDVMWSRIVEEVHGYDWPPALP